MEVIMENAWRMPAWRMPALVLVVALVMAAACESPTSPEWEVVSECPDSASAGPVICTFPDS